MDRIENLELHVFIAHTLIKRVRGLSLKPEEQIELASMLNVHDETAQEFMACMKATIILSAKNGHQKMENKTIRLPTAMPDWDKEPLDPERPALAKFEEKVLQAEDP